MPPRAPCWSTASTFASLIPSCSGAGSAWCRSGLNLDEATSSVDTRTELLVQRAMPALRSDRTSFVIAHRLSTIREADLILVMDAGRIVETHEELLEARGAYHRLYAAQFSGATSEISAEPQLELTTGPRA